jgi:Trk-type K+ transport system membrane component
MSAPRKYSVELKERGTAEKAFHALFASVMMRSGGFALTDTNESTPITLLVSDALMFVGGGSASTAGGLGGVQVADGAVVTPLEQTLKRPGFRGGS